MYEFHCITIINFETVAVSLLFFAQVTFIFENIAAFDYSSVNKSSSYKTRYKSRHDGHLLENFTHWNKIYRLAQKGSSGKNSKGHGDVSTFRHPLVR